LTSANNLRPISRITKKRDFEELRRSAKKIVTRHWILFYRPNELSRARLGVTASRRFGNAVARNRFRRWFKELFRVNKKQLPALDMHFVAKGQAGKGKIYATEFREDFTRLLQRLS
jgi:ribonuclease P protein component